MPHASLLATDAVCCLHAAAALLNGGFHSDGNMKCTKGNIRSFEKVNLMTLLELLKEIDAAALCNHRYADHLYVNRVYTAFTAP